MPTKPPIYDDRDDDPKDYHDFYERLAFSETAIVESAWEAFYRDIWPDVVATHRVTGDNVWQRHGVDRVLYMANGRTYTVDEKVRDPNVTYDDCPIEVWSVAHADPLQRSGYRGVKVGWTLDPAKQCDFVAYALPYHHKCYLLPFELMRQVATRNLSRWKHFGQRRHPGFLFPKWAPNQGYWTISLYVPWATFFAALQQTIVRPWQATLLSEK